MADVKIIEFAVNKEIAKQAFADGVKSSIEDDTEDYIINEAFEDWWSELQIALEKRSDENSGLNIPVVSQQRELLAAFKKDYNKRNFNDCQIADQDIELFLAANSG